jgi:hypothetical protein
MIPLIQRFKQARADRQAAQRKKTSPQVVMPKMLLFPEVQASCSSIFLQHSDNLTVQPIGGCVIVS